MASGPVTRDSTSQPEISSPVIGGRATQPEVSSPVIGGSTGEPEVSSPVIGGSTGQPEVIDISISGEAIQNVELFNIIDLNLKNASKLYQYPDGTFMLVCSDAHIGAEPSNILVPEPVLAECPELKETETKPRVSKANIKNSKKKLKKVPRTRGVKVASKDKPKNYKCKICSKCFLKSDHLESHSRLHTGVKPFECEHCYQVFNTKSSMVRHIRITHFFEKTFACTYCDKKLSSGTHLKQHVMRNHSNERPFDCDFVGKACDKKYCTKEELLQHIQAVHKVKRPYQCQFCRSKYAYSRNLKRHLRKDCTLVPAGYAEGKCVRRVREIKHYKEPVSWQSNATEEVLESESPHASKSKPKQRYQCHICGKKVSKSDHLTTHLRTHTGDKPFKCNQCGRCFNTKNSLVRHGRVHSGERPWTCEYCDCRFSTSGQRTVHTRRVHTHEKPYQCGSCPKKFSTRDCLTIHLRCHTGVMPYTCQWCEKEFARKPSMKRHEKTCVLRE